MVSSTVRSNLAYAHVCNGGVMVCVVTDTSDTDKRNHLTSLEIKMSNHGVGCTFTVPIGDVKFIDDFIERLITARNDILNIHPDGKEYTFK